MLIINRKEDETVDRLIKRYKRKHRRVGILSEIRARKHFTKRSVDRRNTILNAEYRNKKFGS